jgi:tetratricopeptide (TPR) repeat protein
MLLWIAGGLLFAAVGCQRSSATERAAPAAAPNVATPVSRPPPARPSYTGTAMCAGCHPTQHAAWRSSHHDRAMQPANPATVLGRFDGATLVDGDVASGFFVRDARFFVHTEGPDGLLADFEVAYTFGVDPLQQYLVRFPGGRMQALTTAWDARPKAVGGQRWIHLYAGENIHAPDRLHWTGIDQNWNAMCADCHSTALRKQYDAGSKRFETTWAEVNVGCEGCHGPGSAHVAWAKAPGQSGIGLTTQFRERRGVHWAIDARSGNATRSAPRTASDEIDVCAQCHARREQIADGYEPGKPWLDFYDPTMLEAPNYYPDGQQHAEVYVWGSFQQSKMNAKGVTCSDCHDPHSQKLVATGNALCTQCHLSTKYDTSKHHFHVNDQGGSACVDCHMPARTYMKVDDRRDHSFRVPRADESIAYGTPNACNGCHAKQSPGWAAAAVQRWYGHAPQGFQHFAAAFAPARRDIAQRTSRLAALAGDEATPALVRATAMALLAELPDAPAAAMAQGLTDASPLVRQKAVLAIERHGAPEQAEFIGPLLSDRSRIVRLAAADALAGAPARGLDARGKQALEAALGELEASMAFGADRPESRTHHGTLLAKLGRLEAATQQFSEAITLDPTYMPAYLNWADMARAAGDEATSERVLREGLRRTAGNPALRHALGLKLAREKRLSDALGELEAAARVQPDNARFGYVYAVALQSAGRLRDARAALERTLQRAPEDRELLVAAAEYARAAGDVDAERRFVARVLQAYPADRDLASWAASSNTASANARVQ